MSAEDLERYEAELELHLYREYRDVVGLFTYVVETDRRFYLSNKVDVQVKAQGNDVYFEVTMTDAWVWDMYRTARFVKHVRVLTFKDVNVEEIAQSERYLAGRSLTVPTSSGRLFSTHRLTDGAAPTPQGHPQRGR